MVKAQLENKELEWPAVPIWLSPNAGESEPSSVIRFNANAGKVLEQFMAREDWGSCSDTELEALLALLKTVVA